MMFGEVDSAKLSWSHGEGPDEADVERFNQWLAGDNSAGLKVRFEGDSDGLSIIIERTAI